MAYPETSSSIFRRTPGKESEEEPRGVGMNVWMPVRFCTDRVWLSAHSKRRSAVSVPPIAAKASGK
jgi:hypothetical protein